jgi:S-adenosylmethionine:tRNA ribosyltransferase-isomerase
MEAVRDSLKVVGVTKSSSAISFGELPPFDFTLPPELEAGEPPEVRGLARDQVRLLVTEGDDARITHHTFRDLPEVLREGDLLVVNTSGTLPAALEGHRRDGMSVELHLSTNLPADLWTIEVRQPGVNATQPLFTLQSGEVIDLPDGATATLHVPYAQNRLTGEPAPRRLWVASLRLPSRLHDYLGVHGFPIRYGYVHKRWPISFYQTIFVTESGSAEMPSAGRPFSPEVVTRLVAQGVRIAPLLLHTGVASLETGEPVYEEAYRVPLDTASLVNTTKYMGGRVIAIGTTVVRALESVVDRQGNAHPGEGWTRLIISPARPPRVIDGLLTGFHEPRASHLAMLEALVGRAHIERAYAAALGHGYLWHEFGDVHLILP